MIESRKRVTMSGYFAQGFLNLMHSRMPPHMKQLVVVSRTFHFLLSKPKLRIWRKNSCVHLQLLLSSGLVQENCRSQRIQQGLSAKMHPAECNAERWHWHLLDSDQSAHRYTALNSISRHLDAASTVRAGPAAVL